MARNRLRHPDIGIRVRIDFQIPTKARSALKALIPDNLNFPEGLSVKMFTRGSYLWINIHGDNVDVKTVLNTIDEILEHASVCQKVMSH
jgi:hypothetical protein